MLIIRLQRTGRKNLATYRIIVAEKANAAKGKFHEILGHYLPSQKEAVFKVENERVEHWVKHGAIPSDTMARLLKKNGLKGMEKFIESYSKKRSKKAPAEVPAAPTPAPAVVTAPVVEAPASEPVAETPVAAEAAPVETPAAEPVAEAPAADASASAEAEPVPPAPSVAPESEGGSIAEGADTPAGDNA